MIEYRDPITGYMIRRYTEGPERNSKLYFTSENFSVDDKYFFFNKNQTHGCNDGGVGWRIFGISLYGFAENCVGRDSRLLRGEPILVHAQVARGG